MCCDRCACAALKVATAHTALRRPTCALSYLDDSQLSASMGSLAGLKILCVRYAADRHCTVLNPPASALSSLNTNKLSGTRGGCCAC